MPFCDEVVGADFAAQDEQAQGGDIVLEHGEEGGDGGEEWWCLELGEG